MVTTVYAIMKHCLFKFVYQSAIVFLPVWEMVILFIAINKDLLLLCITYYSGLEILLVRSSTSQICEFVDLLFRGFILLFVQLSKNITKYLSFTIIHVFDTYFKGRRGLLAFFRWHFLQGLSFLNLAMTLPFAKLCYAFDENLIFSVTVILWKSHSKLSQNEPENIL